jgi:hypothetical protein
MMKKFFAAFCLVALCLVPASAEKIFVYNCSIYSGDGFSETPCPTGGGGGGCAGVIDFSTGCAPLGGM